jgi:hypothetical protein
MPKFNNNVYIMIRKLDSLGTRYLKLILLKREGLKTFELCTIFHEVILQASTLYL